jgi:hypothetical protein
MADDDPDGEAPGSGFLLVAQVLMWTTISLGVLAVMIVVLLT